MNLMKYQTWILTSLLFFAAFGPLQAQKGMNDICPLKVGAEVPEAKLKNSDGEVKSLADLTNDKPSVLIFYRGAWCGYCTKHLAELNGIKQEAEDLGYQMLGITVDQASKIEESNKRAEAEIQVYSGADMEVIKAFGLDWEVGDETFTKYKEKYNLDLEAWSGEEHHELTVPAVFIIKDGVVQFQYVNPTYSIRLKAETLLAVLKTL